MFRTQHNSFDDCEIVIIRLYVHSVNIYSGEYCVRPVVIRYEEIRMNSANSILKYLLILLQLNIPSGFDGCCAKECILEIFSRVELNSLNLLKSMNFSNPL